MPEPDRRLADALGVGQQALPIKARQGARHDELVGHTAGFELAAPEVAQLDRMVDQFVVVGGLEFGRAARCACCCPHRGGDLPLRRQLADLQALRLAVSAMHPQQQAGAVEKAASGVEKRRPHRGVEGVDAVAQRQRTAALAIHRPGGLVELCQRAGLAALAGLKPGDVAGEFAHHVAARNPDRQRHGLPHIRLGHRDRDAIVVAVQIGDIDAVVNHQRTIGQAPAAPRKQLSVATPVNRNRSVSQCAWPCAG